MLFGGWVRKMGGMGKHCFILKRNSLFCFHLVILLGGGWVISFIRNNTVRLPSNFLFKYKSSRVRNMFKKGCMPHSNQAPTFQFFLDCEHW